MKNILFACAFILVAGTGFSQTPIDTYIKEAQAFIAQKNYKQAQLSLQDAINEINNILAKQIAEALPAEINGLQATGESEVNSAGSVMGMGMQISRSYQHPSKPENSAEVMIMANSPMLNALNMYITNPSLMGQGAKSVRVGTKRAVLKSEMEEFTDDKGASKQIRVTEIQVPISQTLFNIKTRGFATEQEELAFAAKLEMDKIKDLMGE
ncbi:MAG TPA: hypothetical protein PKM27_06750 [Saprospiraceae bacterium]|nr:hypothetical protein [Saprospiraceae bacterium]HNT19143.1 hypothetical protein [Saprospiraceae bacterium]